LAEVDAEETKDVQNNSDDELPENPNHQEEEEFDIDGQTLFGPVI
jgi:hypothetical protein